MPLPREWLRRVVDVKHPTIAEKVQFLRKSEAYKTHQGNVAVIETHMSWVFLVGDRVFKLKKPVKFPYLDYSTLRRREAACRAEQELNRRLAPSTYLEVTPLRLSSHGLSLEGKGVIVDWLVVMRRLDETRLLDHAIAAGSVTLADVDRVAQLLVRFYRTAARSYLSPTFHVREWQKNIALNHANLLNPRFGLSIGQARLIDRAQQRFLARRGDLLAARIRARRIVSGHGDLRPEHIWIGSPPQIIDCLEFSVRLRAVDPFDDIAYLSLECERLGADWVGERIMRQLTLGLHDDVPEALFHFYRCYRATLRARLAIAHLLEPHPRTPHKWPTLARVYLQIAETEASRFERA